MVQEPSLSPMGRPVRSPGPPFSIGSLDYDLPSELIAQYPSASRDGGRLLVMDRERSSIRDCMVRDLPQLLRRGDLLMLNDTRVIPARFHARRVTGGTIQGLFMEETAEGEWKVLLRPSRRLRCGETLRIGLRREVHLELRRSLGHGEWLGGVDPPGRAGSLLEGVGETPLPPYISRARDQESVTDEDRDRYQTVYARNPGAVAAPTAGLHLTDRLLNELSGVGVETAFLTLHVGVGTFRPVTVACIEDHPMPSESYHVSQETVEAVRRCRASGGRVVGVGTTTVRTLESAVRRELGPKELLSGAGSTSLLIYPPYDFQVVDILMTNFHLPRSTLLALVMAFGGVDLVRRSYQHAILEGYRFYSFGDAMLIL